MYILFYAVPIIATPNYCLIRECLEVIEDVFVTQHRYETLSGPLHILFKIQNYIRFKM